MQATITTQDITAQAEAACRKAQQEYLDNWVNTTGGNTGSYPSPSGTLADVRRVSSLDGLAYPEGWYLEFSSAPDIGKPITVLHNFDK